MGQIKRMYSPKEANTITVELEYSDTYIQCITSGYCEKLSPILKNLGLRWNKARRLWQKVLREHNGHPKDRLIEVVSILLAHNYPVIIDDEAIVYAAINEDYEAEYPNWVVLYTQKNKDETLTKEILMYATWEEDSLIFPAVKKTFGVSKKGGCWTIPPHKYDLIEAFALEYNFKITTAAQEHLNEKDNIQRKKEREIVNLIFDKISKKRKKPEGYTGYKPQTKEDVYNALKDD